MTGFKSGASGDDPFADDTGDGEAESQENKVEERDAADPIETTSELAETTTQTESPQSEQSSSMTGLPWIYERDSITDGRTKTVQLHLQDSTLDEQRSVRTDIEDQLGESVKKADLREAALLIGFQQVDAVADQLREWGYDFE
jgi:hypothetical protein